MKNEVTQEQVFGVWKESLNQFIKYETPYTKNVKSPYLAIARKQLNTMSISDGHYGVTSLTELKNLFRALSDGFYCCIGSEIDDQWSKEMVHMLTGFAEMKTLMRFSDSIDDDLVRLLDKISKSIFANINEFIGSQEMFFEILLPTLNEKEKELVLKHGPDSIGASLYTLSLETWIYQFEELSNVTEDNKLKVFPKGELSYHTCLDKFTSDQTL